MVRQTRILVIWEYANGVLYGALLNGDRVIIVKRRMKRLEHNLLALFNEYPSFIMRARNPRAFKRGDEGRNTNESAEPTPLITNPPRYPAPTYRRGGVGFIKKLSAIVVVPERLGGFASSRLLLTTLNLLAWIHDIPLIPIRWQATLPTPDRLRSLVQARDTTFRSMVLPHYRTPADITVSKRQKKYMILHAE